MIGGSLALSTISTACGGVVWAATARRQRSSESGALWVSTTAMMCRSFSTPSILSALPAYPAGTAVEAAGLGTGQTQPLCYHADPYAVLRR